MALIYCRECGAKYSSRARACPSCGYQSFNPEKSIAIYLLLAWFFGIFGAHKFYVGKTNQGIVMLIMGTFGWLLIIPGLVVCFWALIDFIIGICHIGTPEKIFRSK